MADVFISYSRENQALVRRLAEAVKREGYSVWWDDELPPHLAYGDVIAEKIGSAKAAIVVWSQSAAASEWVRAEADVARNQKKLIQVSIDECMPPLPFNQLHFVSIGDWKGEAEHRGWRKVKESLAALCGAGPPAYPMPATPPPAAARSQKWHRLLVAAIAISVLTIAGVGLLAWMRRGGTEPAPVATPAAPIPEGGKVRLSEPGNATPRKRPDAPSAAVAAPPQPQPQPQPAPARRAEPVAERRVKTAAPRPGTMPPRAAYRYCMGPGRGTAECRQLRARYRRR